MEDQLMNMYANYEWFAPDDIWIFVNCFFADLLKKIPATPFNFLGKLTIHHHGLRTAEVP